MTENVTPRQRKAIECLLTTGDATSAAQAAGVSRQTLYRWFKQEHFRAALSEAERQALEALSRRLAALGEKAVETLDQAMADEKSSTRVRAADIVLSRLLQLTELVDLAVRVEALERWVSGFQKHRR